MYYLERNGHRIGYSMQSLPALELYRARYIQDRLDSEAGQVQEKHLERTGELLHMSEAVLNALNTLEDELVIKEIKQ